MGRLKCAAILTHLPPSNVGGIERFNVYLQRLLEDYGLQVEIYWPQHVRRTIWARIASRAAPLLMDFYFLAKVIQSQRHYEFVITNGAAGGSLRSRETAVYQVSHGVLKAGLERVRRPVQVAPMRTNLTVALWMSRLSLRGKSGIIAVSRRVADELLLHYGTNSTVITNCVDASHFRRPEPPSRLRQRYGIGEDEIVGLYAGRWDRWKRVDLLSRLVRSRRDVRWIIATDRRVEFDGAANAIVLRGVDYAAMPLVYGAADFALQMSVYEGFSYFSLEAAACSVPMITTRVGGIDELFVKPELRALLIDADENDEELLDEVDQKISWLTADREYRLSAGRSLRAIVEECFTIDIWRRRVANYLGLSSGDGM